MTAVYQLCVRIDHTYKYYFKFLISIFKFLGIEFENSFLNIQLLFKISLFISTIILNLNFYFNFGI